MRNKHNIEDIISSSLSEILQRSSTLDRKDQIAISQEFKEWIYGEAVEEEIWVLKHPS
tara:strand:+ start:608 stop:781 length:174 start_codon:yes stop_codon:yes gene_type:complete